MCVMSRIEPTVTSVLSLCRLQLNNHIRQFLHTLEWANMHTLHVHEKRHDDTNQQDNDNRIIGTVDKVRTLIYVRHNIILIFKSMPMVSEKEGERESRQARSTGKRTQSTFRHGQHGAKEGAPIEAVPACTPSPRCMPSVRVVLPSPWSAHASSPPSPLPLNRCVGQWVMSACHIRVCHYLCPTTVVVVFQTVAQLRIELG